MLVSDEFCMFVQVIENEVRKVLTINFLISYCGEDVRDVILEKLNSSPFIYNLWDTLTKDVCNKQTETSNFEKIDHHQNNCLCHCIYTDHEEKSFEKWNVKKQNLRKPISKT